MSNPLQFQQNIVGLWIIVNLQNMKTYILAIILILLAYRMVNAQKCSQIDFDAIYAQTENPKSNYYYPKLLKRYQNLDTTLNREEYKHLYYGYTHSKMYNPMDNRSTYLRSLVEQNKLEEAKKIIKELEKDNPVNINLCYSKGLLAFFEKDEKQLQISSQQTRALLNAILTSGDGKSEEKAMVVINIEDEYMILKMIKFGFLNRETTKCCDIFELETPTKEKVKIYFNKEKSSEFIAKMLENNLKPEERKKN
ncbi:MAG: DUF4919 domain-containing protein [Thermonemataceae bacterium]|nr:DUF4919 domain-containing protein [Thermonemataceae bacterium]